jgi:hypothetical protein
MRSFWSELKSAFTLNILRYEGDTRPERSVDFCGQNYKTFNYENFIFWYVYHICIYLDIEYYLIDSYIVL